jgi:hypothetical protein
MRGANTFINRMASIMPSGYAGLNTRIKIVNNPIKNPASKKVETFPGLLETNAIAARVLRARHGAFFITHSGIKELKSFP